MTDDQKKNYEEAAKEYGNSDQSLRDWIASGKPDSRFHQQMLYFIAGATHAHNSAIESAKIKVLANAGLFRSKSGYTILLEELQKLKI